MNSINIPLVDLTRPDARLYGCEKHDEWLYEDPDEAIEDVADFLYDGPLPWTGTVYEYTVLPKGNSGNVRLMSGADIAEHVVDWFGDDCGVERLDEELREASKRPEVIAAFQAAVDFLASHQEFQVADRRVRSAQFTVTDVGEWTIGDWEDLP